MPGQFDDYERGRRDAQVEARFVAVENELLESDAIHRGFRRDIELIRDDVQGLKQREVLREETDKSLKQAAESLQHEAETRRRKTLESKNFWIGLGVAVAIWVGTLITFYVEIVSHLAGH